MWKSCFKWVCLKIYHVKNMIFKHGILVSKMTHFSVFKNATFALFVKNSWKSVFFVTSSSVKHLKNDQKDLFSSFIQANSQPVPFWGHFLCPKSTILATIITQRWIKHLKLTKFGQFWTHITYNAKALCQNQVKNGQFWPFPSLSLTC